MSLKTAQARADAATPGPWWVQNTTACYDVIQGGERTTDARYIAMMGQDWDAEGRENRDYPRQDADSEFIAHSRADLPIALEVVAVAIRSNAARSIREAHMEVVVNGGCYGRPCTCEDDADALEAALAAFEALP